MLLSETDRLKCTPEVLSRVLDGEAVLLHLGTNSYFGMNEVATRAWEIIGRGTTLADLRRALLAEFDVPEVELRRDLDELVTAMHEQKLITVAQG